jgi:hypothetical protein
VVGVDSVGFDARAFQIGAVVGGVAVAAIAALAAGILFTHEGRKEGGRKKYTTYWELVRGKKIQMRPHRRD